MRSTLNDIERKAFKQVQLQLVSSQGEAELVNEREIQIGEKSAVFSLKIKKDHYFYNQCRADSKDICLPLLDFESIMTACYCNNKVIQEHQNNLRFEIQFAQESKQLIEPNRIIKLKSFNFINEDLIDSLNCPQNSMSANANLSQPSHSNTLTSNVSCIQAESQIGARSAQQDLGVQAKCQSKDQASTPANRNKNDRVPKNVNCPGNTQNEEHFEENQNKGNYEEAKNDDIFEKEFLRNSLEMELENKQANLQ